MRISELSQRTGVSAYRLRHYERLGLIRSERTASGYRLFGGAVAREVVFIAMSRDLGFSLKEIGEALPRYRAGTLTLDHMIESLQARVDAVDAQMAELRAIRKKLVSHQAWLEQRRQESPQRGSARPASPWPRTGRTPR